MHLKLVGYYGQQPTWDDVHNGMRKGAALAEPQLQAQREEIEKLRATALTALSSISQQDDITEARRIAREALRRLT